jgi:glycosyltransferase 2 family protein
MTNRALWAWAQPLSGVAILAVLVWRLGTGPLLDGVRTVGGWSLAAAAGIAVVTTICCAWRWTLVARGLGVELPLRAAVPAYYRSQFLNTTLPGGVLGDVHRGVRHGREVGDLGRGMRAVAWERVAGQVVQVTLAVVVLLVLASPVHSSMPAVAAGLVVGALVVMLVLRLSPQDGSSRWARALRAAVADVRDGLLSRRAWPGVVLASTVAVLGHTATFLIAAHSAGATVSSTRLLPLALLVLLATTVPTNIAGWGPREGVAAWAFSAAGLSAGQGVATAVVFGVMVFVASLPGAGVLVWDWLHRRAKRPEPVDPSPWREPVGASTEGAAHG